MIHLVLGSSGQIGKHLTNHLRFIKEEVLEFDILNNSHQDLRIFNNPLLEQYIQKCDIIHFLAYDVGGAKYLEENQNKFEFINNNMLIMSNVFSLIKKHNKPFIFTSSQMSELNFSSYGTLKALGEKITRDLGGIIVRFWNVFGCEELGEKSHVITDFIMMAKEEGEIKMRTDGTESRQFLYADDACDALWTLANNYDKVLKSNDYCITSFKWSSVLDIANIIQSITNCKITPSTYKDTTQQNAMNEPNTSINQWWQPKWTLEEGITKIYNYYL